MPSCRRLFSTDETERSRPLAITRSLSVPRSFISAACHGFCTVEGRARMSRKIRRAWMLLTERPRTRTNSTVGKLASNFSSSGIHGSDIVALGNRPVRLYSARRASNLCFQPFRIAPSNPALCAADITRPRAASAIFFRLSGSLANSTPRLTSLWAPAVRPSKSSARRQLVTVVLDTPQ